MVWAPASRPSSARALRRATISSSSFTEIRLGERRGLLDWATSPSGPASRWRAKSSYSQVLETPCEAATSRTLRFSTSTALMT
jgi:hypothetical protein